MSGWDSELRFAEHLADLADAISMTYFRNTSTVVRNKADGTPVTEADERIEQMLRAEIASTYPDHRVLGEEEGDTSGAATVRWIVDPIDGTKNFSWGIPIWATLIALEVSDEIVCGLASAPALHERYTAARGSGARRNGDPIVVSNVATLDGARLGFTSAAEFESKGYGEQFRQLLATAAHDRGTGDFWGHMLVAAGALDVMVEPRLEPWDLGPLGVIVEEAGGRLTDFAGQSHIYGGSCVTSNGLVHDEVLRILGTGPLISPR